MCAGSEGVSGLAASAQSRHGRMQWKSDAEAACLDQQSSQLCKIFHHYDKKAVIWMHVRTLPLTLIFALALVALGARACAAERTTRIPGPASAVGFNTLTFRPNVTIGSNWRKFNFFGVSPATIDAVQNSDGSVTINPGGDDYGAMLCTDTRGPGIAFTGVAFGGGGYFQATMKFSGPASFWANDTENLNGVSSGVGPSQWPGQATGYGDWIETDFAEFDSPNVYGVAIHNWYGRVGSGVGASTVDSGSPVFPPGADYTKPNIYGFLWVPVASSRQGYAKFSVNGVQIGKTITWNQYNPSADPPPATSNGTAYSVLDKLHLALILGTGSDTSNTVYNVQVWQASAADNISALPTPTASPRLSGDHKLP
jgi:hypothetical protein